MMIRSLSHGGKIFTEMSPAELLEAGVPQAAIDAHLAEIRVGAIKAECRRRIYAHASPEAQMNVATALGAASAKTASARSAEETALIAGAQKGIEWVAAMRNQIAVLAADANADITADASWPDVPAEAAALYSQF